MGEQTVHEIEQDADHDAGEDLGADARLPALEVREREREHHHHQHRQGIGQLGPQRDLVAQRTLPVLLEVLRVGIKIPCRHLLGLHQQHVEQSGVEDGLPFHLDDVAYCCAHVLEMRLGDVLQHPETVAPVGAALRIAHRQELGVVVELVDPHPLSVESGRTSTTLMKLLSSLIHSPERNSWATTPVMAWERTRCASCWAGGPTNSPNAKVTRANRNPIPANVAAKRAGDTPEVLMTVYSEPATRCASANRVPIRAATGNRT